MGKKKYSITATYTASNTNDQLPLQTNVHLSDTASDHDHDSDHGHNNGNNNIPIQSVDTNTFDDYNIESNSDIIDQRLNPAQLQRQGQR